MEQTEPVTAEALQVTDLVTKALARRRQAILYALANRIYEVISTRSEPLGSVLSMGETGWTRIESLSQLRAAVGGRFQNLKQKWITAGLPLREHRGDRKLEANISYEGWIELSGWISKQGFEVRLAGEGENFLFEVRRLTDEVPVT